MRPQLLDLNAVLAGVEQLLRRTLGAYIRLTVQPAADLPAVNCDPGQIEQLLVTLALKVNAINAHVSQVEAIVEAVGPELWWRQMSVEAFRPGQERT